MNRQVLNSILNKFQAGPTTGVFTDGGASPNPGPGGWGLVHVENNELRHEAYGASDATTNNRMELTALIEAYKYLPNSASITIYSDSNLCVQTVNVWAHNWKARGWTKKGGEIKNLELVQELFELSLEHKGVRLEWIKAHNGWRWNEYADALATMWMRE
jgi:ribonuclease HI